MHGFLSSALAVLVTGGLVAALLSPRVSRDSEWRALVTPLASIIGSGFLVVAPILASITGRLAPIAMAGLCAIAWLFGSVIRFNILHAERLATEAPSSSAHRFDRLSEGVLAGAYFVSIAYYLNLLGAFALKGFGVTDPTSVRSLTTIVVAAITAVGVARGFRGIEKIEVLAVSLKLGVIGGILVALGIALGTSGFGPARPPTGVEPVHATRVLLGCVILVQGFETSRFLGAEYDAVQRVRTMRAAQWLSSAIYVVFLALVLPHVPNRSVGASSETAIIDILGRVAPVLGPLVIGAAIASQSSAAVADMAGAGGLLRELFGGRLSERTAYAILGAVAVALTWTVDLYGLIALASRCFAAYYLAQSLLAAALSRTMPLRFVVHLASAAVSALVVAFGVPAD